MKIDRLKQGFTLLELLLVIAIIASLAGIILMALNPAQRLEEANETKYLANARDLKKAIEAYAIENGGILPTGFSSLGYGYYDICKEGVSTDCINIDELKPEYLPSIPEDNNNSTAEITGFKVKYEPEKQSVSVYTYEEYRNWAEANGETLTEGLVGYWKMDEASWSGTSGEVVDSSGNGNNGTRSGDATTAIGKYGNGGTFDGLGDYISFNDNNMLDPSLGSMTWSIWFKTSSTGMTYLYRKSNACNDRGIILRTNHTSGQVGGYLSYYSSGGCVGSAVSIAVDTTGGSYNDGFWHQETIVLDRITNKMFLYVDGIYKTQADASAISGIDMNSSVGKIGYDGYLGSLDEVRIYNRALKSNEVSALYNHGAPLVGWWKMDEGTDLTASDSSGNGNTGTLTPTVSWISGVFGSAISFDGDLTSGVTITSTNNLTFMQGFTASAWVYPKDCSHGSSSHNTVAARENQFLLAFNNTCKVANYIHAGGSWSGADGGSKTLSTNQWSYLTLTYDGSKLYSYVNGILIGSGTTKTGDINNSGSSMHVGRRSATYNQTLNGYVDDFKIYNYARTPEQILKDMERR